jgi:acetylornithine/succinyldiaminopimelate/putrescine aminotransferase
MDRFAAGWVHMVTTEHLLPVYGTRPLLVERGEGCYVFDAEGRRYLDFITGIGVNALGYGHPALVAAIREQAAMCVHSSNLHRHPYQEALAARLAAWSGLDLVFLSNSGTEAMEAALKAARARGHAAGRRQQRIVALEGSFHGRSAGALAVTGQGKYRDPFGPLTPDVVFVGANDVAALRAAVNEETIAIVAETILGEGGIVPLTAEFLEEIRGVATRRDALWIADETQCGLGRTGERFAYQRFGLLPDVVVTAKPLGGGLPLGATMFAAEAGAALGQGMHGTTFGGGPMACRVALAFLEETERLLPAIAEMGTYFLERIGGRGRGLMVGLELDGPGAPVVERAREAGLIINCTQGNVLRFLPPYVVGRAEIDFACEVVRASFRAG